MQKTHLRAIRMFIGKIIFLQKGLGLSAAEKNCFKWWKWKITEIIKNGMENIKNSNTFSPSYFPSFSLLNYLFMY